MRLRLFLKRFTDLEGFSGVKDRRVLFVSFDWVGYARKQTEMAILDAGLVIGLMKQQKDHQFPHILPTRVRVGSRRRLSKEAGQMIAGGLR